MKQFLLNTAKNNVNVSVESSEFIELSTKQRSLPKEKAIYTLNHYELYIKERNECQSYKLFFTISPYMTNILFNPFTEIVINEGSVSSEIVESKAPIGDKHKNTYINSIQNTQTQSALYSSTYSGDRRYQLIRDTECSHKELGDLTYHCGLDIFNNHYLRSNGFFRVKCNENNSHVFNTIEDFIVYSNNEIATHKREMPTDSDKLNVKTVKTHLFNGENMMTFFDAFSERIKEQDGWVGFINRGYVGGLEDKVNRCLNNRNMCDFIDMYPDRTLFSFIPKINYNFGGREEYNWAWAITYPYENVYVDEKGNSFDFFNRDGIKIIWNSKNGDNDDYYTYISRDKRYVYFRTKCKHNFSVGDTIRFRHENGEFSLNVMGLGDEKMNFKEYYFFILYDDLADEFGEEEIKGSYYVILPKNIFVSKLINGVPCHYYVRKFKKIKNLSSTLNRMAFSKTIFNDAVTQVIYDENVNLKGLKDNLGRELSELYFTIIKTNKGREKYYLSGITSPVSVEFSHCFGKVTSGFNFVCDKNEMEVVKPSSDFSGKDFYFQKHNVRSLYNIENYSGDKRELCMNMGITFEPPLSVEDNIIDNNSVFYGDFVEFSPSTVTEITIEPIFHRFNTAQREFILADENFNFEKFKYDEIETDDFDFDENGEPTGFKVKTNSQGFRNKNNTYDNIFPEGYFYKPHYKIKLKEFSETLSYDFDRVLVRKGENEIVSNTKIYWRYAINTPLPHGLTNDDKIILYYKDNSYYEYYVYEGSMGNTIIFFEPNRTYDDIKKDLVCVYQKSSLAPDYAYYFNDGTGKRVWREIVKPTELPQTSDIYDRTYANGAVYINSNINFFLRRQDPMGVYGLSYGDSQYNAASKFIINGILPSLPDIDYKTEENYSICEN